MPEARSPVFHLLRYDFLEPLRVVLIVGMYRCGVGGSRFDCGGRGLIRNIFVGNL
jgi:hypothetical protein